MSEIVTMQLLDLSEDCLLGIALQLSFKERLRLSHVCRKFRDLCNGPSELWRAVEAAPHVAAAEDGSVDLNSLVLSFTRWLAPRLASVEELRLELWSDEGFGVPFRLPRLLLDAAQPPVAPFPLAKLAIEITGTIVLDFPAVLPHLRKLALPGGQQVYLDPSLPPEQLALSMPGLTDFGLTDGLLTGAVDGPWLPPTLTAVVLSNANLHQLPGVLAHLTALRSLAADRNFQLRSSGLAPLQRLSLLQDLNLSECPLGTFPTQISLLTSLRILFLHRAFSQGADVSPSDWEALRPLTNLAFLSISGNLLTHLPPVVAGMSQLWALHVEENAFAGPLPVAPYLNRLRELLLDWRDAIRSPSALSAATRLSRLALNNHNMALLDAAGRPVVPPAAAAEPLLDALGGLKSLRLVEDVVGEGEIHALTPPVAYAMWLLGRRCPQVQLGWLVGTYIGWTLKDLEAAEGVGEVGEEMDAAEGVGPGRQDWAGRLTGGR